MILTVANSDMINTVLWGIWGAIILQYACCWVKLYNDVFREAISADRLADNDAHTSSKSSAEMFEEVTIRPWNY